MSQLTDIVNTMRSALFAEPAGRLVLQRAPSDTNDTDRYEVSAEQDHPRSVELLQTGLAFEPEPRAEQIPNLLGLPEGSEPSGVLASSQWRLVVKWDRQVDYMDWIQRIIARGIHSAPGDPRRWFAEVRACNTIPPPNEAEAGTHLLLTIITRQR